MTLLNAYQKAYLGWGKRVWEDVKGNYQYRRLQPLKEGLAISLLRVAWLPFVVYHFIVFELFALILGLFFMVFLGWQDWSESRLKDLFYFIVDIYVALWTGLIIYAYSSCYHEFVALARSLPGHSTQPILVAGLVSSLRLYEIWAFIGCLHSQRKYESHNRVRAIINTFWHYFEVIICYSTIYLCVACFYGDTFFNSEKPPLGINPIASGWFTPVYFSTITIATVGFGDLCPQTNAGRIAVVSQIMFGIFLFVIVLQRAISSDESEKDEQTNSGPPVSY